MISTKNSGIARLYLIILLSLQMPCIAGASKALTTPSTASTHTLLMFLDDSEKDKLGAGSRDFLTAFMQEAAPILVSASLIDNISSGKPLEEQDAAVLYQTMQDFKKKDSEDFTPEEEEVDKNIILSVVDVKKLMQAWVIKEVNPSLYLMLPNKFLQKKGLSLKETQAYLEQGAFTKTEQTLGLKVNHLKTVAAASIKRPESENYYIDYLIDDLNNIFLTTKEYRDLKANGPSWAIYANGHGYTESMVVGLAIEDFKILLGFLEQIPTKLFMYVSCYAGGKNIEYLYKDAKAGIDKTYAFAIVTDALTDSVTYATKIKIKLKDGKLVYEPTFDYNCFVQQVEVADIIDYDAAIKCITDAKMDINATPQIRFPGLPWFSILDMNRVVSIGSVMAKTRTAPLNIATFFAKKGTPVKPEGILFYAYDIPFELILDTKESSKSDKKTGQPSPEACYMPTFVSMIPKDAVHHLKKISSTCNSSDDILSSFYIEKLMWRKTFIIEEVTAPFSETTGNLLANGSATSGTLTNVIVDVTEDAAKKYVSYNGQLYFSDGPIKEDPLVLANDEQKNEYQELLATYGLKNLVATQTNAPAIKVTHELMQKEKESALKTFEKPIEREKAEHAIIDLLDRMPNNTALHIPKIQAVECPDDNRTCWNDFLAQLTTYKPKNTHKILWIDELEQLFGFGSKLVIDKDIIIEITPKESRVFLKATHDPKAIFKIHRNIAAPNSEYPDGYDSLSEDYAPAYADQLTYFDEHLTLDKPLDIETKSIHKQLTPERIAQIKATLESKRPQPQ